MNFEEIREKSDLYDDINLIFAIEQIKDYYDNNQNKPNNVPPKKLIASRLAEKEIFERHRQRLLEDNASSLRVLKSNEIIILDNLEKEKIFECVLHEIEKIILELR